MPSEQPHTIHASTLTPDLQTIRKQMRGLAVVLFGLSAWLCVGLLQCSINPETPTTYTHPMGSLIQSSAAFSLRALGVVSVAICWLIAHMGALLWSRRVPRLSAMDAAVYLVFLGGCAALLDCTFPTYRLLGAPYGGAVGHAIAGWATRLSASYAHILIVMVIGACVWAIYWAKSASAARPRSASEALLGASPRSSDELAPREEPVQSSSPAITAEVLARFEQPAPRDLPLDEDLFAHDPVARDRHHDPLLLGPRLNTTNESASSRRLIADRQGPSIYTAQTPATPSPSAPLGGPSTPIPGAPRAVMEDIAAPLLMLSSSTPAPAAPSTPLPVSLTTPRADRAEVLRRVLGQLGLSPIATDLHEGEVSDLFTVSLAAPFEGDLKALNNALNKEIKGTFGRVEQSLCALHVQGDGARLAVVWPRREQRFVSSVDGLQHNRDQAKQSDRLSLYVGKLPDERRVQIPFGQISALLVTAGAEADPYLGLNIIISALIYQTGEEDLRFVIASPHALEREHPSPLAGLSYLYTPVMSDEARIVESIKWLGSEFRRRANSFNVMNHSSFKAYRDAAREVAHRVVWIAPSLGHLSAETRAALLTLVERLERSQFDLGLHVVIGARGALPSDSVSLARLPHKINLYAPAEEAAALHAPLSEHLIPSSHDMILTLSGAPVRIHGWQMNTKALESFLRVLRDKKRPSYVVGAHERFVPQAGTLTGAPAAEPSRRPRELS